MKAWTLTASYLWKDIWSRWLETPGAVLARLLVALLLAALLLSAHATFVLSAHSLETRINRLGAQTLIVTEAVTGDNAGRPALEKLLSPVAAACTLVSMQQASVAARDDFGHDYQVLVYGQASAPTLALALAQTPRSTVYAINAQLPPGTPLRMTIAGIDYNAVTVTPTVWMQRFATVRPVVLVPADIGQPWLATGCFETALVVGRDAPPEALIKLSAAIRALLVLDDRSHAQMQSPEGLLEELSLLHRMQDRTQTAAGLVGGCLVALVFGSIAVLEFRQNRFVVALLRSFGAPPLLLIGRYFCEALALSLAAVGLARWGLIGLHGVIFGFAGFEPALLQRGVCDPYTWGQIWPLARWLLLGAGLSMLPVAFGLRQSIGRVLQ